MTAIILSIGDELVLGQTVDTNSAWLSQQLAAVGTAVLEHRTVADDQKAIERAIRVSVGQCDVLIVSGGLGPTEDDLTRQALAVVLGQPLEENAVWLAELDKFFLARGRQMPAINRIQAMIPRGAEMIFNTAGTAAGIRATIPSTIASGDVAATDVFIVPGVPKEMKAMFLRDVLPFLKTQSGGAVILSRTLHTFGLGESAVAEKLGELMRRDRNPSVGTTVSGGVVSLRLNARFDSPAKAQEEMAQTAAACQAALGNLIYGADEQTLAGAVVELMGQDATALKFAPAVCTAESCTGGLIAKMLTDIPGSSRFFRQGYVTYQNQAKTALLGVSPELLAKHGAVSEAVVEAMAAGAARNSGAPYALAVSGIAGPGGGTPDKPVGTVWLALAAPSGVTSRHFVFPGDREMIRDRSAKMALTMLRYELLGQRLPF